MGYEITVMTENSLIIYYELTKKEVLIAIISNWSFIFGANTAAGRTNNI